MTSEIFTLISIGTERLRAVLESSLEVSLIYRALFCPKKFSFTDGIIFSLENCWWSPSELANSVLIRGFIFQYPSVSVIPVSVIKWHPLFTGNTKQRFIPYKKKMQVIVKATVEIFVLVTFLEKKKATSYLLSCRAYRNPIEYILSATFIFSVLLSVT